MGEEWWCAVCTLINTADTKICLACGNAGEWRCSLCGLKNGMEMKSCSVCSHERTIVIDLVDEDNTPERDYEIGEPSYVFSDKRRNSSLEIEKYFETDETAIPVKRKRTSDYEKLIELEKNNIIINMSKFECAICMTEYGPGAGIVLRECFHTFCQECIKQLIKVNAEAEVRCPFGDGVSTCPCVIQEREIKALVDPDVYEKYLKRSLAEAECKMSNTFHCKTPNCAGWCVNEDNVNQFSCPVCQAINCLNCKVIHTGMNCKSYQEIMVTESDKNSDTYKTKKMLEQMLKKKTAMVCPTCGIILTKGVGCDWLQCVMCKTEICWATRGPRWGPKGKGDTSSGCRCRVKNKLCHPKCQNCH